jgi:glycosyltransferase involved in cell wall biosynthesis
MSSLRILFINENYGLHGGVEQNILDAAKGLGACAHKCYLAYGSATKHGTEAFDAAFHGTCAITELGADGLRLEQLLSELEPDVVFFHKTGELSLRAIPEGRFRRVQMVHDHDLSCPRRHKYSPFTGKVCDKAAGWRCYFEGAFLARDPDKRFGFRYESIGQKLKRLHALERADCILVGSHFMKDELAQNGLAVEKIQVLAPAVTNRRTTPSPVPSTPRILFVGQLIRGKGVDLLLQALSQLMVPFEATLAGTGNAEDELKRLAGELGLGERVRFAGFLSRKELAALYDRARSVVVPSRWPEPFGMVGLEAMWHGRPVVGFDVGGIADWLQHGATGLLVAAGDTGALARAMERVLSDLLLARFLGNEGYRRVTTQFDFDRYLSQLENHLSGSCPTLRKEPIA